MSQVIAEEINPHFHPNIGVLSGPNLAREIIRGLPAAAVVAAAESGTARKAQKLLTCPNFCVFTNTDVIGVELGGALKNIIALGAGIADGLGYGDNAKAAFMTRGLTEITALGTALGANPLTFSGLAGLGDIITTCASPLSRNHYVGTELAKGRKYAEILESMTEVAEGVNTTLVARNLARQLGLEMPITEKIYRVLYEDADCRQAAAELMGGNARHELSGRRWQLFSLFRKGKNSSDTSVLRTRLPYDWPRLFASSSNSLRCSLVNDSGVTTRNITSWSPRPMPCRRGMPLSFMRKILPVWLPAGIFSLLSP